MRTQQKWRITKRLEINGEWTTIDFMDIKKGDVFKWYDTYVEHGEILKEFVGHYTAFNDAEIIANIPQVEIL